MQIQNQWCHQWEIYIDNVYHQTYFEAAAATVVTMMYASAHVEPDTIKIPFIVNYPFYLAILGEERLQDIHKMLFLGKVNCIGQPKC